MKIFLQQNNKFLHLVGINLISKIGDRLFYTTLLTIASVLPNPSISITLVSLSEMVPILLGFILGSIADIKNNKVILIMKNSFFRFLIYLLIGYLMGYHRTFIIVLCIIILNLLSGVLGNYTSALIAPFTKLMVVTKDMTIVQSFISTSTQLVNVIATFAGAFLLFSIGAKRLADVNALVFLLVILGLIVIKSTMEDQEKKLSFKKENRFNISLITNNFKMIFKDSIIANNIVQISLLNGFVGALEPLFVLFLNQRPDSFLTKPISIAILSGSITLAVLLGTMITTQYFTKWTNNKIYQVSNFFLILTGISFFIDNPYLLIFSSDIVSFFLGITLPRFTSYVMNHYPTEKISGIITTINSAILIMPPLTSILFPLIAGIGMKYVFSLLILYGFCLIIENYLITKN